MQVRPIEPTDIGTAAALVERGFAKPPMSTWPEFLNRLVNLEDRQLAGPIGYLLRKDNSDVGIILTLRSRRHQDCGATADVVNLSSWYIDEPHRWYAPMMLKKILRDKSAVFTDLTASEEVRKMLPALKFQTWTEGVLTTSLPQTIARFRRDASISSFDRLDADQLDAAQQAILHDHQTLGCISCVLSVNGTDHPLIFKTRYRRGIPHAYLIYARDRAVVMSALGNICLHLLGHGHFLVAMDCNENECVGAGLFRRTAWHKYFAGPGNPQGIDYAYSELVYLDCQ